MSPELALAINQCAAETFGILIKIGKKIREVRKFKSKCSKLESEVKILQHLIDTRRSAIEKFETVSDFRKCMQDVERFVDDCRHLNTAQIAWEVIVRQQYASLYRRCVALKEIFLFESVVEILAREDKMTTMQRQASLDQQTILAELRERAQREREARNFASGSRPITSLSPTLLIDDDIEVHEGFETSASYGRVELRNIELTSSTSSAFEIYKRIQTGARVQRLFGFIERSATASGQRQKSAFAVLQDLRDCVTLNEALERNMLPESLLDRLQMAYDVAKSMAWCHRAELLLKVTSDRSIVAQNLASSRPLCVLTGLEHARLFLEQTTTISYDRRYDAPEYLETLEHSRYTECWSIGVIIWQLVYKRYPYDIQEALLPQRSGVSAEYEALSSRIRDGENPGSVDGSEVPVALMDLIENCWNRNPLLRPTSSEIATLLQDVTIDLLATQQALKEQKTPPPPPPPTTSLAPDAIDDPEDTVIDAIIQRGLLLIEEARRQNLVSSTRTPISKRKMAARDFSKILDTDEWTATKYFVIGALIFWDLVDGTHTKVPDSDPWILASGSEGRRAESALFYLEPAGSMGYEQACCEIYKAHASLAREFRDRFSTIPKGSQSLLMEQIHLS